MKIFLLYMHDISFIFIIIIYYLNRLVSPLVEKKNNGIVSKMSDSRVEC